MTNCSEIPCVRFGKSVRYDPADLRAWIDRRREADDDSRRVGPVQVAGCQAKWAWLAGLLSAHDDHNPSLSITEGDDGRALLKCHAGCTTEDVVAALTLRWRT